MAMAAAKGKYRKSDNSINFVFPNICVAMKAAPVIINIKILVRIELENHPSLCPSAITVIMQKVVIPRRANPSQSNGASVPFGRAGKISKPITKAKTTIGSGSKNINRQLNASIITPPI